jgi:biopolymer transport protein ExbD
MRRFSQRSHLVTLNEINITPLLDLAFVLLIIFVITTPLLDRGLELKLPEGGKPDRPLNRNDFRTLEIEGSDVYLYEGRKINFAQLEQVLAWERQRQPSVVIFIRADRAAPFQDVFEVADLCGRHGLGVSFRSEPRRTP